MYIISIIYIIKKDPLTGVRKDVQTVAIDVTTLIIRASVTSVIRRIVIPGSIWIRSIYKLRMAIINSLIRLSLRATLTTAFINILLNIRGTYKSNIITALRPFYKKMVIIITGVLIMI
jgi:hypothetical protein